MCLVDPSPTPYAAFSPAVSPADVVVQRASRLAGTPVGLWCGRSDGLYPDIRALHHSLPTAPAVSGYGPGDHNVDYWSTVIPPAFDFIAETLSKGAPPGATLRSPGETHVLLRDP